MKTANDEEEKKKKIKEKTKPKESGEKRFWLNNLIVQPDGANLKCCFDLEKHKNIISFHFHPPAVVNKDGGVYCLTQ